MPSSADTGNTTMAGRWMKFTFDHMHELDEKEVEWKQQEKSQQLKFNPHGDYFR